MRKFLKKLFVAFCLAIAFICTMIVGGTVVTNMILLQN